MKLLDEKGLTTVWAAIKNTFTSKSDADGKYAKTADVNTALAKKVDAVSGKGLSTNDFTAAYKSKLDGIASGANNYTLPVASTTTLGGIKTDYSDNNTTNWPVKVDDNNNAYVPIQGLTRGSGNTVQKLSLDSSGVGTTYNVGSIGISSRQQGISCTCYLPKKDGTFALTSDIPDVSSLCKFNSANNINLCVYGRINLMKPIGDVNLDSILGKDGIIIFARLTDSCNITCSEGFVYNSDYIDNNKRVEPGTFLITIDGGVPAVLSL